MKNSINLVAIILLFVVLGCSCPKLGDLTKDSQNQPSASPASSNAASTPKTASPPTALESDLTMEKYNQLKIGMARSDVERILGGPGTEVSTSRGGGVTFGVYKWADEDYDSIILTFRNDKILTKSQVGLK